MTDELLEGDMFFEAITPLGFRVRVIRAYWDPITTIKHPVMSGRESDDLLFGSQCASAAGVFYLAPDE